MALFRARSLSKLLNSTSYSSFRHFSTSPNALGTVAGAGGTTALSRKESIAAMKQMFSMDITSQFGSTMPLSKMRIGTLIHNIEIRPGQGGKLVRSAGTSAKLLSEPRTAGRFCEVKLPSGAKKLIDTRCRATIGTVSNPEHGTKKLRKAGQSRWLGRRPVVRGVAMNPIDHPHGGGEGKSKSSGSHGRVSLTPWGKPCKSGYKTGPLKRRR